MVHKQIRQKKPILPRRCPREHLLAPPQPGSPRFRVGGPVKEPNKWNTYKEGNDNGDVKDLKKKYAEDMSIAELENYLAHLKKVEHVAELRRTHVVEVQKEIKKLFGDGCEEGDPGQLLAEYNLMSNLVKKHQKTQKMQLEKNLLKQWGIKNGELINRVGVDYLVDFDDGQVLQIENWKVVGLWNNDTATIEFDGDEY